MNDFHTSKILDLLSESRMTSYRTTRPNDKDALEAYEWSLDLGQALLKPIGIVEVAVRNMLDKTISAWWGECGYPGTWIDAKDTGGKSEILQPFVHASEWRKRAQSNKPDADADVTHDDIIAHTSLGTWRNMIGNPAAISTVAPKESKKAQSWHAARQQDVRCAELWKQVTSNAFPFIPETKRLRRGLSPRGYIGARLTRVSYLRNRVCHWDNLMTTNIGARYDDMEELARAIDPDLYAWLREKCSDQIKECVASKPS